MKIIVNAVFRVFPIINEIAISIFPFLVNFQIILLAKRNAIVMRK